MTNPTLDQILTDAKDLTKRGGGAVDLATTAVRLARHIRQAQDALEPLKSLLRDLATTERKAGDHHVAYEVEEGRVSVTFPTPRYIVRRLEDAQWDEARDQLGKEFNVFFRETLVVKPQNEIESLLRDAENAQSVLQYLERDEPTPRVGFKPA